ncbi:virulence protein RhuM/Fic/DOC family protein [Epilithonimonas arachidiradicis]|uniref:Cytochrome c n=1 Tax=Epilithonimonas arachidiradicis TaxID=1617282 RepID=A0A420DCZ8_9FLAO|nr:virulence protein RhuM/Fic/DOC family protein [Epilithonimonas arachidiradicis]RKE89527.1 death-on-curing family protein [Epilithonimonas arachidiradicis]GGG43166.1 cytochrome c [Epilithonimonas arachidiradicis]
MKSIEIYTSSSGNTQIEVQFEKDTVWLSLNQISELFQRDKSVISRHLSNIFKEEELEKKSVVAKYATTALDGKTYQVDYYNLDAILSVGYRVNSKQGTQFRIWASQRLKDYLLEGVSINTKRLQELEKIINIIENAESTELSHLSEAKGLLNILNNYTKSFILLNQFDSSSLELNHLEENITYEIDYNESVLAIEVLKKELIKKKEASELFGNQKDKTFEGILKSITQTFDSQYLYPTIEEQASNLLYFIIKNHPFSDGNKRIGAFIFIWFLEKNKHLLKKNGEKKINDNALTALALLIAQSNPNDKELMIKLICNLITN